jgi:large subunit ribosomal protein L10
LAISKEKKQQMVADYVNKMSTSRAVILTDYQGLTVSALTQLRRNLREDSGGFQIVKNTLFKLAIEQAGLQIPDEQLEGPIAIGYCFEEIPPVAKTLTDFAKETQLLKIKGAMLGGSFLDTRAVEGLADLPPREVLRAQLVSAVQSPMSNLVSTLAAPMRELVQVLKARSEQSHEAAA